MLTVSLINAGNRGVPNIVANTLRLQYETPHYLLFRNILENDFLIKFASSGKVSKRSNGLYLDAPFKNPEYEKDLL